MAVRLWCDVPPPLLSVVFWGCGQSSSCARPWYSPSVSYRWCTCRSLRGCCHLCQTSSVSSGHRGQSSVMYTLRNLKLLTLSTSASPVWMGRCPPPCCLLWYLIISSVLLTVREVVVLSHPICSISSLSVMSPRMWTGEGWARSPEEELWLPVLIIWGLPVRKLNIHLQMEVSSLRSASFLHGKCATVVITNAHSKWLQTACNTGPVVDHLM